MRAFGVDVSSVQGKADWGATRAGGIVFAYAQGTRGVGHDIDPTCVRNVKGAKAAGILGSLYHWWVWKRPALDQAAEVEWAVGQVGGVDYPVALDFEYPAPEDWASKSFDAAASVTNLVTMAEDVTRRLGRAPLVYTFPYFMDELERKVEPSLLAELGKYELWIASGNGYNSAWTPADTDAPSVVRPWTAWRMWQFSGNGGRRTPGLQVVADRDVFNGDESAFRAWASGAPSLPAGCALPGA